MTDNNTVTLQSLIQFALPLGASVVTGVTDATISWSVTVRARPPALPDIAEGEMALISMDILRSYDSRMRLEDVLLSLTEIGVDTVAVCEPIAQPVIEVARDCGINLISLPADSNLSTTERAINKLIVNQAAQLNQRAFDIQRQLTALAAENRDLNSLLTIIAKATAKPLIVHDDAGVSIAQVYPNVARRGGSGRALLQSLPYSAFQNWLKRDAPMKAGIIVQSSIGYTTVLKVEKRVAGYLTLADTSEEISEFDELVLTYGAEVCAIEMAKNRAIASAVEQARGDWVQMWLSGTPADDDLLTTRAAQAGFNVESPFVVAVFRATTRAGAALPLESLISLVRDDMARRNLNGAVGQYVDVIVALYPLHSIEDPAENLRRVRVLVEDVREQLTTRTPSGIVSSGISRTAESLERFRTAYREAKDAISIAAELGEREATTFYGDLKLYQLLLNLKEKSLQSLRRFYDESLRPLVDHDERKQGDLVRTLNGFFETNGNLAKAAVDLDVHRNTLVYRLERISELTGLDLNDADNRLILHLALKIQRVLATMPGGE
jgi:PucR family transcriptional regulator, purine catabolism regulatory protein